MVKKEHAMIAARCCEYLSVGSVIASVWLVMLLPIVIYFIPLNPSITDSNVGNTTSTELMPCQNLLNLTEPSTASATPNDDGVDTRLSATVICRENFFLEGGVCKPDCNSWLMFQPSIEKACLAIIGICAVVGILTTIAIVVLSLFRYKDMLVFPSILILYQDILVSVHGVNILIGYMDRRLFCPGDNLVEAYESPASPYCIISGLISGQVVLPLAIWITIQIGYTLLAVRAPLFFKNLTQNKRKSRILHIVSVVIGIVSLVVPAVFTLAFGGYTLIDTRFPPIVCLTRERDLVAYTILIPLGILMALIVSFLVLILHTLIRNRCINNIANKDLKKAEIKVFTICCCYVILGLGASLAYSISSAFLDDLQRELSDYFECERCGVEAAQCDRTGFERLTNPGLITVGYSLFVLYPVITLVYVFRVKRTPQANEPTLPDMASKTTTFSN